MLATLQHLQEKLDATSASLDAARVEEATEREVAEQERETLEKEWDKTADIEAKEMIAARLVARAKRLLYSLPPS
ncbi:hypothetical protein MLD38_021305 [Melastoma candidum]|uniref:Uncharacterized protein n=1 Tax=Melastoma candidum TaxID=119954 RepID=A0ACB9QFV1_9MYRT|nr:hypothetical protein MLD38_021305 [Melastoma candidum]